LTRRGYRTGLCKTPTGLRASLIRKNLPLGREFRSFRAKNPAIG
jgi:hypothetical protein